MLCNPRETSKNVNNSPWKCFRFAMFFVCNFFFFTRNRFSYFVISSCSCKISIFKLEIWFDFDSNFPQRLFVIAVLIDKTFVFLVLFRLDSQLSLTSSRQSVFVLLVHFFVSSFIGLTFFYRKLSLLCEVIKWQPFVIVIDSIAEKSHNSMLSSPA